MAVGVDAGGLVLPARGDLPGVLDLLVEGRRVCSVDPRRAQPDKNGDLRVAWVPGLRHLLRGRGRVVVREHLTGDVLLDAEVAFTEEDLRVAVVDHEGHPIAFDKWGQPGRSFELVDAAERTRLATRVRELVDDLVDLGVPAFLAYGSLLGAVREGRMIGHDFDADIAYLSQHTGPADLALESFWLQRALVRRGWLTRRPDDSMLQLHAWREGEQFEVDIFPAFFGDDGFQIPPLARGPLSVAEVLPPSSVTLEGVTLPAPADPDAVLQITYGPHWRVPDPAFSFSMPKSYQDRMQGWMGNHLARPGRWRRWHRHHLDTTPPASDFARWVTDRLEPGTTTLDAGCGTGHDLLALAERGPVVGLDYADEAVDRAREVLTERHVDGEVHHVTIYDLRTLLALATEVATRRGPKALYARLTLDALGRSGRRNLLLAARVLLLGGASAYLEVRVRPGNPFEGADPAPWAQVLDLGELMAELRMSGGEILTLERVPGPAPQRGRRTELARLHVRW